LSHQPLLCRKHMLSYDTENRLKHFLVAVGDGERTLENLRQRLCSIRDFVPAAAYQRINRDGCCKLHPRDFVNYLRDLGNYSVLESECNQLVRFFDSDNDGGLG
jgi:hypothetical protein